MCIIVLVTQTLELGIAPGAPDPKPDVGETHEKIPSHRRSEVLQSDSAMAPVCCPWAIDPKTAERLCILSEEVTGMKFYLFLMALAVTYAPLGHRRLA